MMPTQRAFLALLAAACLAGPARGQTAGRSGEHIPNQYVVVLQDQADAEAAAAELSRRHGLALMHVYRRALKGFSALIPPGRLKALGADPRVRAVGQDRTVQAFAQTTPTGLDRIDAEPGLPAQDGLGVQVAVIDTGVDRSHADLSPNLAGGVTLVTSEASTTADGQDDAGHGTHVAGTIAAAHNAGDVVGVGSRLSLWAVKVLNSQGSGSFSDVIAGVDWVADTTRHPFIAVANMSLGATCSACTEDSSDPTLQALRAAIQNAVRLGTTFVVAAGNEGVDARNSVPAAYDEVVTVSALADTDGKSGGAGSSIVIPGLGKFDDDTFAKFSNFGADVDLIAPGVSVLSTRLGGGTTRMSGTSMASPHVAGAAALLLAANPGKGPAWARQKLLETAECADGSLGPACAKAWSGDPDGLGEPLVNANRASRVAPPPPAVAASLYLDKATYVQGKDSAARLSVAAADENGAPISGLSAAAFAALLDGAAVPASFAETATPGLYEAILDLSALAAGSHAVAVAVTDGRGVSGSDSGSFSLIPQSLRVVLATDKANYVQGQDHSATATAAVSDESGQAVSGLSAAAFASLLDGAAAALSYAEVSSGSYRAAFDPSALVLGSHALATTATDARGLSDTGLASFNVVEPGPTVHVQSIAVALAKSGRFWKASAKVQILDQAGQPVSGVAVAGDFRWNGGFVNSAAATTDAAGLAVLSSNPVKARSGDVLSFAVTSVEKAGAVYDVAQNLESSDSATVP